MATIPIAVKAFKTEATASNKTTKYLVVHN